ncbi:MAG: hypothetical protein ACREA0_33780, partial [bacterium]
FPDRGVPSGADLVVFDGFDQLDKESAVRDFSGRTRGEVTRLIGGDPSSGIGGLWGIEELEVLEPPALQYYLEPFLRFLIAAEYSKPDEFTFWLSYHLSEVIRRRGPEIFTAAQREVLEEIATHLADGCTESDDWTLSIRAHCISLREWLAL